MSLYSVNIVKPADQVLPTAIALAKEIANNSPDAVQSTKVGLVLAQKHNIEEAFYITAWSPEAKRTYEGKNIKVCNAVSILFFVIKAMLSC